LHPPSAMPGPSKLSQSQIQRQVTRPIADSYHQPYLGKGKRPVKVSERAKYVLYIQLIYGGVTTAQEHGYW
jgi:hypothetical protein